MKNKSAVAAVLLAALVPVAAMAVETRIWDQSEQSDFTHGTPKHISIRSDGHLSLAPSLKEVDSTTVPYLWAIARDSKGTLYYAGGAPTGASATVYARTLDGKTRTFGEVTGLEIHALAVDSKDRLYAAVLPDAKIYRLDGKNKPELFFDPKCKYVWSMAFDKSGNLFVATGDSGLIYKVTPDGKGTQFANTNEAHARSMLIDASGDLIVGTEPGGLVMKINPQGQTFVLYQTGKREVTAVAEHNGVIYAAAVGNKQGNISVSGTPPVLPASPSAINPTGAPRSGTQPPSLPPAVGSMSVAVSGGSELDAVQADGSAEKIWQSPSDIVYAIAFDAAGKPIIGTGNKGTIYEIDSPQLSTQLLTLPPTQVTALVQGEHGVVYAATGNVGNVYVIGPGLDASGTLESDVLDAGGFSYWGEAHVAGQNLESIKLETRSGNLNSPQHDWSPWAPVALTKGDGRVDSPAARFLQYRLTLANAESSVTSVDIPFVAKNEAPRIKQIELAPVNYRESPSSNALERSTMQSGSPLNISVPAVGQKRAPSLPSTADAAPAATLQYSKGFITARWSATDANTDPLEFKVEVKQEGTSQWTLLKDKLQDYFYAFDSNAFPDGRYVLRITATDELDNTPATALTGSLESDSFIIDNTPPQVAPTSGGFTASDNLSWIAKAEYSVDGGAWALLVPVDKVTEAQTLQYSVPAPSGHMVTVRVFDDHDNVTVRQLQR